MPLPAQRQAGIPRLRKSTTTRMKDGATAFASSDMHAKLVAAPTPPQITRRPGNQQALALAVAVAAAQPQAPTQSPFFARGRHGNRGKEGKTKQEPIQKLAIGSTTFNSDQRGKNRPLDINKLWSRVVTVLCS